MPDSNGETSFFPHGAVAFFLSMIVFYAVVWFALYYLMAHRG